MTTDVKRSWEALAKFDPMWAILSDPSKRSNRWDAVEFFDTGKRDVAALLSLLSAHGLTVKRDKMLDFGCGVGRLTQAFADHFAQCDGVDIAEGMISQANSFNRHGDRVRYHVGQDEGLSFPPETFDLVYTKIVLQHMPVASQARFVGEFLRVVAPGGLAVFQTPAECLTETGSVFRSPIETPDGIATIDMNVFPRREVESTIAASGGQLVVAIEDQAAGPKFRSFTYIASRC